jgi:hypothetical protein
MEYSVGRIPGQLMIDPEVGDHGQRPGQQRKREKAPVRHQEAHDRIDISDEARRRSSHDEDDAEPEVSPGS